MKMGINESKESEAYNIVIFVFNRKLNLPSDAGGELRNNNKISRGCLLNDERN